MRLAVEVLLGVWLVLTMVKQGGAWWPELLRVFRHDVLQLVPAWTFFAPNPVVTQLGFYFRLRSSKDAGAYGGWLQPDVLHGSIPDLVRTVFNPHRRVLKELADTADTLQTAFLESEAVTALADVAALHRICAHSARQVGAVAWEFVLTEGCRKSGDVESLVLISEATLNEDELSSF